MIYELDINLEYEMPSMWKETFTFYKKNMNF